MDLAEFRQYCPWLNHFTPQLNLADGLLTAAQVLDRNRNEHGNVWARFRSETEFASYPVNYWKTNSRFLRRAGESGCCLFIRDSRDSTRTHVLGNNYPLGDGSCLGTTIPLTDNRPGDPTPSREEWFATLNSMFWVFPEDGINTGFVERLRLATPGSALCRVRISTRMLTDEQLLQRVRLSAINGGGSNGACARGTSTYKPISEWFGWPPREIGLRDGLPANLCASLQDRGGLPIERV